MSANIESVVLLKRCIEGLVKSDELSDSEKTFSACDLPMSGDERQRELMRGNEWGYVVMSGDE